MLFVVAFSVSLVPLTVFATPLDFWGRSVLWQWALDQYKQGNTLWDVAEDVVPPLLDVIDRGGNFGSDPDRVGVWGSENEQAARDAYDDYLTTVQDTIGTTAVGSGGFYYTLPATVTKSDSSHCDFVAGVPLTCTFFGGSGGVTCGLVTTPKAPVPGYYTFSPLYTLVNSSCYFSDQTFSTQLLSTSDTLRGYKLSNGFISDFCSFSSKDKNLVSSFSVTYRWLVEPFTYNVNDFTQQIGGANSRFTNINGDIGYYGDNGQLIVAENASIVDETNNTYFNPVTNSNNTITDWSYDYSTRTYNLTLADGDKTSITYGDENITIIEGDTTYNIYYVVPNDTTACEHTYQQTSTTPATCVQAGSTLYTCSKCQTTKTEAIPALGHDWTVKQSVTTQYDDAGNLVAQGYTLYECSRCGEQYKDEIGTGPPDSGGGTDTGDSDGVFKSVFSLLLDFFKFFWQSFNAFAKNGIRSFLKALADGASDIFGLLNPLNWLK